MDCVTRAWHQHLGELRGFLAKRLADRSEVDEILQGVFERVLVKRKAFCRLDDPRAWIFTVARHALVDLWRRERQAEPLPADLAATESEVEPLAALAPCVSRVWSELSQDEQAVLGLVDLEGVSQNDLAARLGLSPTGARSRVQRARKRLSRLLIERCQVEFDAHGRVTHHTPCCLPDEQRKLD
ncbi:MAG TPA: sigma-70 family RNA polymerase sigma factor [Polyangia bacterium]